MIASDLLWICFVAVCALCCKHESLCRKLTSHPLQICGSGYWQDVNFPGYECSAGHLVPIATTSPATPTIMSSPRPLDAAKKELGATGYWSCIGQQAPVRDDDFGKASYLVGGRMASVYSLEQQVFRCDLRPPETGYYVAVWTRYDASQVSQPAPENCNTWLKLRNSKLGRTATALVIDRCASCVGVGRQTSDSQTPDSLVNGATIDLSPPLWEYLYGGAPWTVYDIEYDGPIYGGSPEKSPDVLTSPICA